MNREQRLARAAQLLKQAEDNPTCPTASTWVGMANTHIRLANATESMNVLTDKELAQARRNVQLLNTAVSLAQEMIAAGGEAATVGRILYDKIAYG